VRRKREKWKDESKEAVSTEMSGKEEGEDE
jgi:hypothetical protein